MLSGMIKEVKSKQFEQIWIIHFKRSDYAKLCMSPSLDRTLPEYVISQ